MTGSPITSESGQNTDLELGRPSVSVVVVVGPPNAWAPNSRMPTLSDGTQPEAAMAMVQDVEDVGR